MLGTGGHDINPGGVDAAAVKILSVLANEDRPRRDMLLLGIIQQQFSQLTRNEYRPGFAFATHCNLAMLHRFNSKILQLGNTDSSSADGLQDQV